MSALLLHREREADQQRVEGYVSTRNHLRDLENAKARLHECCDRLHRYLDDSTTEGKRAILEMLAIKVTATSDTVGISGVIPLESVQPAGASPNLLTTVRTSGYHLLCTYDYPSTRPTLTLETKAPTAIHA